MSLAVDRLAHRGHAQAVKKRKMPTDVNQRAAATARMVDAILGDPEAEPTKNPAAVALGKLGGAKGGLEMAIWARGSTLPGLVHHSDRQVLGGFKGPSQHCLVRASVEVPGGPRRGSSSQVSCVAEY